MEQKFTGAVIDIGTNSVRLLVGDRSDSRFWELYRAIEITRLGKNLINTHRIGSVSIEKTIKVVKKYVELAKEMDASQIAAYGTAALREAENSDEVIEKLEEASGVSIQVISGEEEALATFLGTSVDFNEEPRLVIDIGGGSTEVVAGGTGIDFMMSIPVGCVKVLEEYELQDRLDLKRVETVKTALKEIFNDHIPSRARSYGVVVALGGTATSLSAINLKLESYNRKIVHLSTISHDELELLTLNLSAMSLAERKKIPSLEPERADVIVSGAMILLSIVELLETHQVTISEHDILDGLFLKSFF